MFFWRFFVSTLFVLSLSSGAKSTDKPVLTIYTYDAFAAEWGPAPIISERFQAICNCTLKFVAADSSIGALRKIQLEGPNTAADILLGLDTNIADAARKTGLFSEHGVVAQKLNLPVTKNASWADKTFLPFDYSYFAFVYDKTKVTNPPGSFEELVARGKDFKIVIQDPRASTPGLGLLLWIKSVYGDEASRYWEKLSPQILTVTKSWSDAYGLFLKGEAEMVLSYTTSPAYHLIAEENASYASASFKDGHYAQIEVAAVVKSSKQKELARKFMRFMLTPDFQSIIPTTNWTYPVGDITLPNGFETLSIPKKGILMDGNEVEASRKAWINEWLLALEK